MRRMPEWWWCRNCGKSFEQDEHTAVQHDKLCFRCFEKRHDNLNEDSPKIQEEEAKEEWQFKNHLPV